MSHKCFRCGTEFEGNFCPECGEKWQEEKTCPTCGASLPGNAKFCNQCGYSFVKPVQAPAARPATMQTAQAVPPARTTQGNASAPSAPFLSGNRAALLYAVCRYLPIALIALFSVLLFLLCLAPAAIIPGGELFGEVIPSESLGNVYEMLSGEALPALKGCCVTLIVFASLMLACAAAFVCLRSRIKDTHAVQAFWIAEYASLFAVFIVSCAMFGVIGKEDEGMGMLAAGAAPVLILVFSLLFALFSAAAFGLRIYWDRSRPEVKESYEKAVAARKEAKDARFREYAATHPAPAEPQQKTEKPKKPKKPLEFICRDTVPEAQRQALMPEMEKHIKKKRTLASLLVLFFGIFVTLLFIGMNGWFFVYYSIPISLAVWLAVFLPCSIIRVKGWHPEKVYKHNCLRVWIYICFALFFGVCCSTLCIFFSAMSPADIFGRQLLSFIMLLVTTVYVIISFLVMILLYRKTAKQRKALCVKLCGAESPEESTALVESYEKDVAAYRSNIGQYKAQLAAYRENRRAWDIYNYQTARYKRAKPYDNVKYPLVWCSVHKKLLALGAVLLAGVIALTCILATMDRRFSADNLIKIGLGADRARVEEVLGKPDDTPIGDAYYYYSGNYTSILKDMKAIEEKSQNSESLEELDKLSKEYEKLQKQLEELEYKRIVVIFDSFDSNGKVLRLLLDTCAVNIKAKEKTVKEVKLSSDTYRLSAPQNSLSYTVIYEDGSCYMEYFSADLLPTQTGSHQKITWSNIWGTYTEYINVYA